MAWWKDTGDGYVNGDVMPTLDTVQKSTGVWRVRANITELKGDYATQQEAMEAARKLCQGIDPSTITGGA